jgi:hypothetical protein
MSRLLPLADDDYPVRPAYDRLVSPSARGQALAAGTAAWYGALPGRRRELVQDGTLALLLAVLNFLSLLPYQSQMHPSWLALFLVTAQCAPLTFRRVNPLGQAVTELRRLLGVLRAPSNGSAPDSPERSELAPSASLSRIDEVLAHVRGAGVAVSLAVSGTPVTLSPGIDLTATRSCKRR